MNRFIQLLLLLFCLASFSFFSPINIDVRILKSIYYILFILLTFIAFQNKIKIKNNSKFKIEFISIISSIIISIFMSYIVWEQSIIIGIIASSPFLISFGAYFLIQKLNLKYSTIEMVIIIICLLYMVIYIISYTIFPIVIFGNTFEDIARGNVKRVSIGGSSYLFLSFFIALNKYKNLKSKKWLVFAILCYTFVIVNNTRQNLVFMFILGSLMLFHNMSYIKKTIIISTIALLGFIILPNISYVQNLMELTQNQIENNKYEKEDIRIESMKFYIDKAQPNTFTRILGNGIPSYQLSEYGRNFDKITKENKCFAADIGIPGFYYFFGIISVFALFNIFIKTWKMKPLPEYLYAKYFIYMVLFTGFSCGMVIYPDQILVISIACLILNQRQISYIK